MESLHPSTYRFPPLHQPTPWGLRKRICWILEIPENLKMKIGNQRKAKGNDVFSDFCMLKKWF